MILWEPTRAQIDETQIAEFSRLAAARYGVPNTDYDTLWRWSVEHSDQFWELMWEQGGVIASSPSVTIVRNPDRMPGARWFEGARLNYAENLLRHSSELAEQPAILFRSENGTERSLSWRELRTQVAAVAAYLRNLGVVPGDRIAAYVPNCPEVIVAMLASASIGAVWSSTSPDFGLRGVLDRFEQIAPKVLFVADGYSYGGKWFSSAERADELLQALTTVEGCVLLSYGPLLAARPQHSTVIPLEQILCDYASDELRFEQLPFDHPLFILYSSGTTGAPKCIVHGAGGTLLQHLKEHRLHVDLRKRDRMLYFTTCGWMMWNWLVSSLASGCTVCLYDGSPMQPDPLALFRFVDDAGIQVLGVSAKYLTALEKAGVAPNTEFDLRSLRVLLSTGSPLPPHGFRYVYQSVKRDLCLSSISGGTDIVSCFVLGNPALPVREGEIQCRGLGMSVEIFDDHGRPTLEKGELVCTRPFPSMPIHFWNDPDGKKYYDSYFGHYPGVWRHGDWAEVTRDGGVIIYGRSDSVLNPGGVRIGSAEIYRQVEEFDFVQESLVVGQRWDHDERIILFVKLGAGVALTGQMAEQIRRTIREHLTPRHVPALILQVSDIPKTLNGKISEAAVRRVIHGEPVKNLESLANPECLDAFRDIPELRS